MIEPGNKNSGHSLSYGVAGNDCPAFPSQSNMNRSLFRAPLNASMEGSVNVLAMTLFATMAMGAPTKLAECVFPDLTSGDKCQLAWSNLKPRLHPTQNMLGYAWVQYKIDKYMDSGADAQDELDSKPVPVCLGPQKAM